MKIGGLVNNDLANGPGIRTSVFVSGCTHHCAECHNPELWNFDVGQDMSEEIIDMIVECLTKDGVTRGLSILGGEPMHPKNVDGVSYLIYNVKQRLPNINIWLWTGYTYEDLVARHNISTDFILEDIDVLVDGPFKIELKPGSHPWRGSSNQRVIYLKDKKEN